MNNTTTILRDIHSGKSVKLPKIHGNKKIRNILTGKKDRTMVQWRRAGKESANRLIKAFAENPEI